MMSKTSRTTMQLLLGIITVTTVLHNPITVVADRPAWLQEAYDWAQHIDDFPSMNQERRRLQAMDACQMDAMRNELAVSQFNCECQDSPAGVRLVCIPECAYCNDEQTSCGIRSAQALYDVNGTRIALGGVIQYTTGCNRGDVLSVEQTGCTNDGSCAGCAVFANGHKCNSCILRTCPNSTDVRELIDCENIEEGAIFDLCGPVQVDTGIFEGFSTAEYEECLDPALLELHSAVTGKGGKGSKSSKSDGKGGKGLSRPECPESSSSSKSSKTSKKQKRSEYGKGKGSAEKISRSRTHAPVHPTTHPFSTKTPHAAPTMPPVTTHHPTVTRHHVSPPSPSSSSSSSSSKTSKFDSYDTTTYKKAKGRRRE